MCYSYKAFRWNHGRAKFRSTFFFDGHVEMSIEFDILREVVQRLEKAAVPYMITGSIAANFFAVPRMTRDIDIVIELSAQDVDRLYGLFEQGFYIDRDMVIEAVRQGGMFNIIHLQSVFKIDFIVRKNDPYRIEEFKRRMRVAVGDLSLFITAPEDLVLSKLRWAKEGQSELQLRDAANLLGQAKDLDIAYLERWAKHLDVADLYARVRR